MSLLSVIVPCYNEEAGLEHFVLETNKVINSLPEYSFRYILVNDGSKDRTYLIMKKLAKTFNNIKYISFSRNFGKEAAMYAGLKHTTADYVVVMDADLQPMEGSHPEYHRLYADLQLDLTGGEGWGYETEPGTEVKPYSPDIGFKDSPDAVTGTLGGGRFVIFFPGELHRPGIAQPDCKNVHKAVVKIRMEDKYHG